MDDTTLYVTLLVITVAFVLSIVGIVKANKILNRRDKLNGLQNAQECDATEA
jgi:uncharacterized membrane protein (DUF485 family)